MTLSPQQAESLASKLEQLCEGAGYILIINDLAPDGMVENDIISNLDDVEQAELMLEAIEGM